MKPGHSPRIAQLVALSTLACSLSHATAALAENKAQIPGTPAYHWSRSLPVEFQSTGIGALGGTEARILVPFDGKLFAGIGYWRDTQADDPRLPGAQVIALDAPDAKWRVDLQLNDAAQAGPGKGKRRFLAIGALNAFTAHQDSHTHALPRPIPFLLASVWDRVGGLRLFVRGAGSRPAWQFADLATKAPRRSQIRSFGTHIDSVTKQELFFAGTSPGGVYSGTFADPPTFVHWNASPEKWDHPTVEGAQSRIMAFVECNGKLYASSGFGLFERQDGSAPSWKKIYTYESPSTNPHVSGFRGMKAIPSPEGGQQLLIAVENNPFKIIRVDPRQAGSPGGAHGVVDLEVSAFLAQAWHTQVRYGIAAYNDMLAVRLPGTSCDSLFIGFEARTPQDPTAPHSKHPSANYLVRRCDGGDSPHYELYQIEDPKHPGLALVATRTLTPSPFGGDPAGTIYAGGLDAGNLTVHNTAWIYRGVPAN